MEKSQSSGWFYRLTPQLVIRLSPGRETGPEKVLLVRSGQAFPPGHPTTRLCLDLLREALAARAANRILDLGCGAGVLSLAAAALKTPYVLGLDISRQAAQETYENAWGNHLGGAVLVAQGSTECVKTGFDLVIANLPWEVQMSKVAELDRVAARPARLILSGFRDNQEDQLRERFLNRGWALQRRVVKDFWHPDLPAGMSFTWVAWLLEAG